MGQVHIPVILTNYREALMARLGQHATDQVHRVEVEALIDTGAPRSVLPPHIVDRLGLLQLSRTEARYADGRYEEEELGKRGRIGAP